MLFREGEQHYDFFVVLDRRGRHRRRERSGAELIAVHGPGRFLGELSLLTGQAAFFTAVVREPGAVLVVPAERLRELVGEDPALGDLILRAYLLRRSILIGLGAGFRIIGSRYSPDTRRLRDFAARNRLPHAGSTSRRTPRPRRCCEQLGVAPEETPVVIWRGDDVLRNPSTPSWRASLGLRDAPTAEELCDLIVVGAGPAGLAASVYGASEGLDDGRARRRRHRRPGGHLVSDRELPRVPGGHLGRRAGGARDDPGRASSARASPCPPRPSRWSSRTATTSSTCDDGDDGRRPRGR